MQLTMMIFIILVEIQLLDIFEDAKDCWVMQTAKEGQDHPGYLTLARCLYAEVLVMLDITADLISVCNKLRQITQILLIEQISSKCHHSKIWGVDVYSTWDRVITFNVLC